MSERFQIAQFNTALPKYEMHRAEMAGFTNALEAVNAFAEASDGFVWRLKDEADTDQLAQHPFANGEIINISVWETVAHLKHFVYHTGHATFIRRKKEWFEKMPTSHMVLWWIQTGHHPTIAEAVERLTLLDTHGPTQDAFTFNQIFALPNL